MRDRDKKEGANVLPLWTLEAFFCLRTEMICLRTEIKGNYQERGGGLEAIHGARGKSLDRARGGVGSTCGPA